MTVSSVRSEEDDGAGSSSDDGNNNNSSSNNNNNNNASSKNTFKKSRPSNINGDSTRPPRPTYTARFKDGKYTVGVETVLFGGIEESSTVNSVNNNNNDNSVKNANDADAKKLLDGAANPLPSFHRSRDRTRISAVQRLVERKLAQKERERLKEREVERDRLSHHLSGKVRSSSSNSCYVRERSWDATYSSSLGGHSFSASGNAKDSAEKDRGREHSKTRTEKENEYLASLLWRTSRSCSGTRRRGPQSDGEEEVAKTIITIGPGKPTRIREHSPSKRSPTSELPPSNFGQFVEENDDKPTPLKSEQRDQSPSKRSEPLFKNSSPLKSTGLFREFAAKTTTTTTTTKNGEKRKTSFTTEKTFQVNVDSESEKARRLSIDCNYVYERSPPTFSTFSQADDKQAPISSSTSSLTSSFSSTSSADLSDKEPIRLSRLRPATFTASPPTEKRPDPAPEPPIRERKTSRRIFISTAFNSKNDSSADDTSSNVSSGSSNDDSATTGSDGAGSPFSSASSRLLFNLSSGYRYHRAAAAANSPLKNNSSSSGNNQTHHININVSKNYNANDASSYPRRRFSQEHLAQEDKDTFGGESVFVTRPVRQPVRKISLPVRPMREQRREATRWDDSANFSRLKMSGDGEGSINNDNGELTSTTSSTFLLHSWSKYKLCDDSLFYPGCCVEHDRLSLGEKSSASIPSESSGSRCSNISTNNYCIGDGAKSEANLHVTRDNVYFYNDCKTDDDSLFSSNVRACTDVTGSSSYYTDSELDESCSFSDETVLNHQNAGNAMKGKCMETKENDVVSQNDLEGLNYDEEFEGESFQEDDLSLSTLSGSGMDFFRKFVRRKDQFSDDNRSSRASTIKEGINLIDRLIYDTMLNKSESPTETICSENFSQEFSGFQERLISPFPTEDDETSELEVLSISKESSVSGSGLLYLRNYLKKKSSNQNEEEDDKADLSWSESRRSSVGSTLADLLNETFDSEDSELQKLDWDEFEDDPSENLTESYDVTEEDIGMSHHISTLKSFESEEDLENENSTPILSEAEPLNEDELDEGVSKCGLSISIESTDDDDDDDDDHFSSNCSTAKNSPSIQTLNPPDLLLSISQGFKKLNLTGKEREELIRSMKENEPVKKLILSSPTTFSLRKNSDSTTSDDAKDLGPKKRLTDFWEKCVLQSTQNENADVNNAASTSFRPAMPSYYNPESQCSANERIRIFLEVTRKAVEESQTSALTATSFSDSLIKRSPVTSATSSRI